MIFFPDIGTRMSYPLNFHQTFKPERIHISSLLSIEKTSKTKEELSHIFSIPTGKVSGKVEVNLLYAKAAGLLKLVKAENILHVERTPLGNFVYNNDSFIDEYITKVLFHFMFSRLKSDLILWETLFRNYHRGIKQFKSYSFAEFSNKMLTRKRINLTPLWGTYIADDALINIGLLTLQGKDIYIFGRVDIIDNYAFWYAYFLIIFCQGIDSNRRDFTLEEILQSGFASIFGWNKKEFTQILEILQYVNLIDMNKQFSNFHIYLTKTNEDILNKLEYF